MSSFLSQPYPISHSQERTAGLPATGLCKLRITWISCGAVNLATVVTLALWIAIDPVLSGAASDIRGDFSRSLLSFCEQASAMNGWRRYVMLGLLLLASSSAMVWMTLVVIGRVTDRSIRSCLALTGVFALWLACLGSWHDIAWAGKRWRAVRYVQAIKPIGEELRTNWPSHSGDHKLVGMYLSYPTVNPRSMILMACPATPIESLSFNGVERTEDGGIAFPMVGVDGGDWLEWHPMSCKPDSYLTGLQQNMRLSRFANLEEGWFLVRYAP